MPIWAIALTTLIGVLIFVMGVFVGILITG